MKEKPNVATIDEYIALFPEAVQKSMIKLREVIHQACPQAGEKISWGMATFTYYGNLLHFAGAKNHLGFYPAPEAIEAFQDELTAYQCSKGAIQFPYSEPVPYELITRIVAFRAKSQQNAFLIKEAEKKAKKEEIKQTGKSGK